MPLQLRRTTCRIGRCTRHIDREHHSTLLDTWLRRTRMCRSLCHSVRQPRTRCNFHPRGHSATRSASDTYRPRSSSRPGKMSRRRCRLPPSRRNEAPRRTPCKPRRQVRSASQPAFHSCRPPSSSRAGTSRRCTGTRPADTLGPTHSLCMDCRSRRTPRQSFRCAFARPRLGSHSAPVRPLHPRSRPARARPLLPRFQRRLDRPCPRCPRRRPLADCRTNRGFRFVHSVRRTCAWRSNHRTSSCMRMQLPLPSCQA
jgi:hypothetical protein